jgi:hypothetical protein
MNLLKQIDEDKKKIVEEARALKELADKDKNSILIELQKIKEIAKEDIKKIREDSGIGEPLDL